MALLIEDSQFSHVIAIDFGTGASGYVSIYLYDFYFYTIKQNDNLFYDGKYILREY